MLKINWSEVETKAAFDEGPKPGGYVLKITGVTDVPEKQYLKIEYDIAEGEYEGWYKMLVDTGRRTFRPALIRSYKESARGMFKHFLQCLENSNPRFKINTWDYDEQKFEGLKFGAVLNTEEYEWNGETHRRFTVIRELSVDDIKTGNFKVPDGPTVRKSKNAAAAPQPQAPKAAPTAAAPVEFVEACPF